MDIVYDIGGWATLLTFIAAWTFGFSFWWMALPVAVALFGAIAWWFV